MKFSTKTTYGLRAMAVLSENWGKKNLSLQKIADSENISKSYLERIFSCLKEGKLVLSEKGMAGGYSLAKNPAKISVFEIVNSIEGDMTPFHCSSESGKIYCSSECKCGATKGILKIQDKINNSLKSIKLSEL